MSLLRPQVADDRGKRVLLTNGFDLQRHPDLRRTIERARRRKWTWWLLMLSAFCPLVGCGVVVLMTDLKHDVVASQTALLLSQILALVWALTAIWMRRHWIRQLYIDAEHCGKCLYGLSGLRAEADGCTVCPECGAAWRLKAADGQDSA